MIIEAHGAQHYTGWSNNKKDLEKQIINDKNKYDYAINNGISDYIVVDCRNSDINWLKENFIKKLSHYFNLSNIDWDSVFINSQKSLVINSAELWNSGYKIKDIYQELGVCRNTALSYVKIASNLGLCNYDPKEEMRISGKNHKYNHYKEVYQYDMCGNLLNIYNSLREASQSTGCNSKKISATCKGTQKSSGGFIWSYESMEDEICKNLN